MFYGSLAGDTAFSGRNSSVKFLEVLGIFLRFWFIRGYITVLTWSWEGMNWFSFL